MPHELTLIMPYYDNPGMLAHQYKVWSRRWPEGVADRVRFIIVDDGSMRSPASGVVRPAGLDIEIYRVLVDRPWHQHGARNLGAHVAPQGWLLMTDMDHVLEGKPALNLLKSLPRLPKTRAFMLERIEGDGSGPTRSDKGDLKPHPNSFVMTRQTFWHVGGYDEDYCGVYGTDRLFRGRLPQPLDVLPIALTRYWRDLIPDASTTSLPRKEGRPPDAKKQVERKKRAAGRENVILTLDFPWQRVC